MIKFYSLESNQIIPIPVINFEKIVWCDAIQPSEGELNEISNKYNINLDDLKDCLDETERPRFNYDVLLHNNFLLIRTIQDYELYVSRPPTTSLGIFITKTGKLVTIRNSLTLNFENIIEVLNRSKIENNWFLILGILHILITQFDKMSQIIAMHIKELQDQILKTQNVGAIQKPFQLNSYVIFFSHFTSG
ncbi:MAG: CorA family divalent cation transporter, partial [Candidatus Thorarchaeota archaeon]